MDKLGYYSKSNSELPLLAALIGLFLVSRCHQIMAVGVLADASLQSLDLDEEYVKSLQEKFANNERGFNDQGGLYPRADDEPFVMDKGAVHFNFEDEAKSWSAWSPSSQQGWSEWTEWTGCIQGYRHRSRRCQASQCSGMSSESRACNDVTTPPDVRASWATWATWSSCNNGNQERVRQCLNGNYGSGSSCVGNSNERKECQNPVWSSWGAWGQCENSGSSTRTQTRQRNCLGGENNCIGFATEARQCSAVTEPTNWSTWDDRTGSSQWGSWNSWSVCSAGRRSRNRACQGSGSCSGNSVETQDCTTYTTPQPWSTWDDRAGSGQWGSWNSWSACSAGRRSRTRVCQGSGSCSGNSVETLDCEINVTPQPWSSWNGWSGTSQWGSWNSWSNCNAGRRTRTRTCQGSVSCVGNNLETEDCQTNLTPQPWSSWDDRTGQLGSWNSWSACSAGRRSRNRVCQGSGSCSGNTVETQDCTTYTTPQPWSTWEDRTGQWGSWNSWSACSAGRRSRNRVCQGSGSCSGNSVETQDCTTYTTPQPWSTWEDRTGQWGSWNSWSACSAGRRSRNRVCQGSGSCIGNSVETQDCTTYTTPQRWSTWEDITGQWGSWNSWSACSAGRRSRNRVCQGSGSCSGNSVETQDCTTYTTPQPWSTWEDRTGQWGSWNSWSACSAGRRSRNRVCQGSGSCSGNTVETQDCTTYTTPQPWSTWEDRTGQWGSWNSWSACSAGRRSRNRVCQGSGSCIGNSVETQDCTTYTTPQPWSTWEDRTGQWGSWNSWSACSAGRRSRNRVCQGSGSCSGNSVETQDCTTYTTPQPWSTWEDRTGQWGSWNSWSACSAGRRSRNRVCQGSGSCSGNTVETQDCTTYTTPQPWSTWDDRAGSGQWGSWNSWSACSAGRRSRTRVCQGSGSCSGNSVETLDCEINVTPQPWSSWNSWSGTSQWGSWNSWSNCNAGRRTRTRTCQGSASCVGNNLETEDCQTNLTPQPWSTWDDRTGSSQWGSWNSWSFCVGGIKTRTRMCQGSGQCAGVSFEREDCSNNATPQPWSTWDDRTGSNQWGSWSEWTVCRNGIQERTRLCQSTNQCSGSAKESRSCSGTIITPITDPSSYAWGTWGSWSACNGGTQTRMWTCVNNKEKCRTTPPSENRACNGGTTRPATWSQWTSDDRTRTRVPSTSWSSWGDQSQWSSWSSQGDRTRTQSPQQNWSQWSSWTSDDNQTKVRPSQNAWGRWSNWSPCNQGLMRRSRQCQGRGCSGNNEETSPCYMNMQPGKGSQSNNGGRMGHSGGD